HSPPLSNLFPYTTLFRSAAKVLRGSWKPMRASRRARSFTGRLVGGTAGLAIGTIGTLASLLALAPNAFEVVRKLGLVAHREASRSEEHTSELQSRENLVC